MEGRARNRSSPFSNLQADHLATTNRQYRMAGRVYLSSVMALVMAAAHVSAFYLPHFGGPFMHPGFLPGIHPFAFPFAGKFGVGSAPRAKPLSRPFTLADAIPGGSEFPYGGGNFGGFIVDSGDGLFGGDVNGIIGGGLGGSFIGGNDIGLASTNDLNSLNFVGAAAPGSAGVGVEISDSTVAVNSGGLGFYGRGGLIPAFNRDLSDLTFVYNDAAVGGFPAGSVVQAASV